MVHMEITYLTLEQVRKYKTSKLERLGLDCADRQINIMGSAPGGVYLGPEIEPPSEQIHISKYGLKLTPNIYIYILKKSRNNSSAGTRAKPGMN